MKVLIITKRKLIIAAIVAVAAIILLAVLLSSGKSDGVAASGFMKLDTYELEMAAGKQKELPVYSVERDDKKIALTIDAAWEDDKTEYILEQLDKYEIKATFFLCGFWAEKYAEDVKDISAAGHEIGNHTATHPHMNSLNAQQMVKELSDLDDMLEKLTGKRCKLFRAPYGEYNDTVIKTVRSAGYEVIQWNLDTVDWREERSAQTILDSVLPKLTSGSIILCHNNGFKIKEYLPKLIEGAKEKGFEFVTVSELLLKGDTMIDVNGVQKHVDNSGK